MWYIYGNGAEEKWEVSEEESKSRRRKERKEERASEQDWEKEKNGRTDLTGRF